MTKAPPPGWASDALTHFFDLARSNAFATYHHLKGSYRRLSHIDAIFLDLFKDLKDPPQPASAALAIRAHAAWRAAVGLAIAGQLAESYAVLRSSLENALYANRFDEVPSSFDVWTRRAEDEKAKRACRNEFSGKNLFDALRARDARGAAAAGELYERTIDLGAHPNELAVLSTMSMDESDEGTGFSFAYLTGDGLELRLALKTSAQVGVAILDIIRHFLADEFKTRGLEPRLEQVRVGL